MRAITTILLATLLCAVLFPVVASSGPAAAGEASCDPNLSQTGLNQCWDNKARKADVELNAASANVSAGLRKLGIDPSPLIGIRRAWMLVREKTCTAESTQFQGGSMLPMIQSICVFRMTRACTSQLRAVLDVMAAGSARSAAKAADPAVEARLDRLYRQISADSPPEQRAALSASELAWRSYREMLCAFRGDAPGSSHCLTQLEQERIDELRLGWGNPSP